MKVAIVMFPSLPNVVFFLIELRQFSKPRYHLVLMIDLLQKNLRSFKNKSAESQLGLHSGNIVEIWLICSDPFCPSL